MYNKLTLSQENRPFFLSSLIFFILILIYTYFVSDPVFQFYEIEGYDDSFRDLDKVGVFSALLIAPVLEEFIFRGYLTGYRKHFLFIIPQIIILFIVLYDYFILISLFSALLIFLFYYDKRRSENLISNQLLYFSIFFTSILFSLIHYKNFQIDSLNFSLTLSLIAFLPGALFLAYVRYKKGLVYSVLVHFLFNLLTLTINGIIY